MRPSCLSVAVVVAMASIISDSRAAERIFWAQRTVGADRIGAAAADGSSPTLIVDWPTVSNLAAIAVDSNAGKLYWLRRLTGEDAIVRSDLDGQNVTTILSWPAVVNPVGITLDPDNGHLFWVEAASGDDRVRRANLDGTAATTIVTWPTVSDPVAITYDRTSQRLYWAEGGFGTERIVRATDAGANAMTLVAWPQVSDPVAISVDAAARRVFWIEASFGDDALRSVSIVGGSVATVLSWPVIADPTALVVDGSAGRLYWTESNVAEARIARTTTAGDAVTTILASPLVTDLVGIALEFADPCVSSLDCDDLDPCTVDACDVVSGQCSNEPMVCPPAMTCSNGVCTASCSLDADCDDAIACTVDACTGGVCFHAPQDALCETGLFCSQQRCDEALGCVLDHECLSTTGNPCADQASCDEAADDCGGCRAPTVVGAGARYLSITPVDQGSTPLSFKIEGPCDDSEVACVSSWVQSICIGGFNHAQVCQTDADCPKSCELGNNAGQACSFDFQCSEGGGRCLGTCTGAAIGAFPIFRPASEWGEVRVGGIDIRPSTGYQVSTVCEVGGVQTTSAPVGATTFRWGDANGNGVASVTDIVAVVDVVKGVLNASVPFEGANMWPCEIDLRVTVSDITVTVDAVKGLGFPCAPRCP